MSGVGDERGSLDAPIWCVLVLLLFGLLFSGYTSYHALTLFRGQVQQDLDQATRLAAEQVEPSAALTAGVTGGLKTTLLSVPASSASPFRFTGPVR